MESFDYIVIGAGSAGCVLANRLSHNPAHRVLLLEAGGSDKHPFIRFPVALHKNFHSPRDWAFQTVPQPNLHNRAMFQPRGKVLGGSSSINAMIYIRGHRSDYDNWGLPGWDFESVLPWFKKHERNLHIRDSWHGTEGEQTISNLRDPHPLSQVFQQASTQAGHPLNPDFNGASQEGFGFYQVTQQNGLRMSAADAFLKPVLHRPNLAVRTQSLVRRIHVENGRATSVLCGEKTYRASREIILCAGAFQSPQILMLSGLGPAAHLREFGIPVVADLPGVGQNLQDHLIGGLAYHCRKRFTLDTIESPRLLGHLWKFLNGRRGQLTSNVAEGAGFVRTNPDLEAPDIQFLFAPAFFVRHGLDNPKGKSGFSLGATLIAPFSRGRVQLASGDPEAPPLIDPAYFSDSRDLSAMIRGFRIAQNILQQPAFDPYRGEIFLPAQADLTEEAIAEHLRETVETLYHPTGTCRMGQDALAVVDPQLRVRGVDGLRIADASVMPEIVRGNTHAPVMMIAEKAADLLLSA